MLKREARKPPPRQRVPKESAKPAVPEEVSVPPPSMSQMAVCGDPPKDPGLVPPRCGCHMEECICHLVNHLTDRTEYKYRPNDGSSLDSNAGSDRVPRLPEVPLTQTRPTEDCPGLVPMAIATPVDNRSDSETSGGVSRGVMVVRSDLAVARMRSIPYHPMGPVVLTMLPTTSLRSAMSLILGTSIQGRCSRLVQGYVRQEGWTTA